MLLEPTYKTILQMYYYPERMGKGLYSTFISRQFLEKITEFFSICPRNKIRRIQHYFDTIVMH